MSGKVLIVDDEKLMRISLESQLKKEGYHVKSVDNALDGLKMVKSEEYDVVVTDLRLTGMSGMDFLKEIKKYNQEIIVVIMTAYGTLESAVLAIKEGAHDYIAKPFSTDELIIKLQRALHYRNTAAEVNRLRGEIQAEFEFCNIVGNSEAMKKVLETVMSVSEREATILIRGESGTGKEKIAGAIHYHSCRKTGPFIRVSCAALNREILESELFGHEKGAFTGAIKTRRGRFELANGGSIFLDDVDDIPLDMQVKLLRVLQERTFERVGGEETLCVDVRIICATKKDLLERVKEGGFREDLFYRLNVVPISIPPLRERKEDIPLLINYFLKKFVSQYEDALPDVSQEAFNVLLAYDWPGNVRELENVVEHAIAFSKSKGISLETLPEYLRKVDIHKDLLSMDLYNKQAISLQDALTEVEKKLIQWAHQKTNGNQVKMAEILGIPRTTLRNRLVKLQLFDKSLS
ncbi:MAG: sigma-54-dependent Fis family transcriptional regulator [Candidatus Brocadia sp. AMX2]|uniref:sigma-54-dependent transcriptional regulator n=1 Tax=Candidatus Brocadia sp. AMX2 TaxID=2293635 RepID=UPI000EB8BC12|nr:sigma-54 dependent transcriptional regulator [Candidatus Brocadia sp. AMX2]MBC6933018.1 sigma-54-dependent Fis family transcriptional regulator [Candidatus Brocadia sp.]KAA0243800.1 MAG: sigma-54-dependent Fis family transcriptional regulator [Candidatus Brocadia sp. AMX2]MCE7867326.1 sigma-54-dependent Fis family transcriptional regulator [Candidatus Brocadia sp. AMX2]MCQ3918006.1 sigma-54-dependent Fis family transcriptional regulator [Candidatus Brocadia sp.]MDL1936181.1 sigma-54-depende